MRVKVLDDNGIRKVIVIAPHADDEVLGAGGLIAKLARKHVHVRILFTTIAGYRSQARNEQSQDAGRLAEVKKALKVLGVDDFALFRSKDPGSDIHLRLDTVPQAELIQFIEDQIVDLRPQLVIMPCRGHYHQDHRAVADACIAALRPAPDGVKPFVRIVLAYGHAAAGWGGHHYGFSSAFYADISDLIDKKIEALSQYHSQVCAPPHPRSLDAVRCQAATAGGYAGCAYAEAFECVRYVLE